MLASLNPSTVPAFRRQARPALFRSFCRHLSWEYLPNSYSTRQYERHVLKKGLRPSPAVASLAFVDPYSPSRSVVGRTGNLSELRAHPFPRNSSLRVMRGQLAVGVGRNPDLLDHPDRQFPDSLKSHPESSAPVRVSQTEHGRWSLTNVGNLTAKADKPTARGGNVAR